MSVVRYLASLLFRVRLFLGIPPREVREIQKTLGARHLDLRGFARLLGYQPRQWGLFIQALLHRSYLQFVEGTWSSNERLEFLGDAVLNSVVAEYLYAEYPGMEEGNLTKLRSRLVNRKILAQKAKELQLGDYLLLSISAAQSVGSGSDSIVADALEAVIGALYLDGGHRAAQSFIYRTMLHDDTIIAAALTDDNYKSALLEYSQGHSLGIPRYAVVREEGPEHERRFTVEVFVGVQSVGVGTGRSKKEAEQAAAAQAIERIQQNDTQTKDAVVT